MDLKNVVAISCRTNTGEMFEVPVREFFGLSTIQSNLGPGVVPKSDGKAFVASGVTEGPSGQLTFKNYKSETSFTGIPVGMLAYDANGRVITVPFQQTQSPQKTTTEEVSAGTSQSTTNKLPIWVDNEGGLGDSDIIRDGESYSVGGTMPFWKWDVYQGSVNITQSSVSDGFRLNGKLVVSYDPDSEELTIGNTTYTTTNIKYIKTDTVSWNASGGGSITDVATATASTYTLIKPAENGTYATREWTGDNFWKQNGNALTASKSIGSTTAYDWSLIRNNATIATVKSTGLHLANLTTNYIPKHTTGGLANSLAFDNGDNFVIGTNTNVDTYSRLYVFGGVNGANIDARPGGGGYDQSIIDLQGSDYATTFRSAHLRYQGVGAVGTTMGYSNVNLADLAYNYELGDRAFLIRSVGTSPIVFGINGSQVARIASTGLHLSVLSAGTTDTDKFLVSDSGVIKYRTGTEVLSDIGAFAAPSGLTTNYVTKWGGTALANSQVFDNGTNVGIGTVSPTVKFDVSLGNINLSNAYFLSSRNFANTFNIPMIGRNTSDRIIIDSDGYGTNIGGGGTVLLNPTGGNVGIGTASPANILQVNSGATPSVSQFKVTANNAGSVAILNYSAGNSALTFDSDFSGTAWIARNTTAFQIYNVGGNLNFNANSGLTSGSSFSPTARMTLTSSGNVGIGTTPSAIFGTTLDVYGASSSSIGIRSSTITAYLYNALGYFGVGTGSAHDVRFETGSVTRMTLTSSGNVGIGTASPSYKLDVNGSARFANFYTGSADNTLNVGFGVDNDTQDGWINYYGFNGGATRFRNFHIGNGKNSSIMSFVGSTGNVGIGTASPLSKIHVSGSGGITWGEGANSFGFATIGDTTATGASLFVHTASLNAAFHSGLGVDGTYTSQKSVINLKAFGVKSSGGYGSDLAFHTSSNTTLSEAMRITSSGNVGIGTVSPSYKLHTAGVGLFTSEVFSDPTGENGYRLKFRDYGGTANDAGIGINSEYGALWFNNIEGGGYYFNNGSGGESLRINSLSNTNSVANVLDIKHIPGGTTANGLGVGINFTLKNSTYSSNILTANISSISTSEVDIHTHLVFSSKYNNTLTEAFRIGNNSYVGIGTTSPSDLLHVNGTSRTTNLKITNSAAVGKVWQCTNADGTGAWTTPLTSERYIGEWAANSGSAPSGSPTTGDYWVVNTAGTYSGTTYATGDEIYWNGTTWLKRSNYLTFPIATSSILGGIKIGSNLAIDGSGVVTVASSPILTTARTIALSGDGSWSVSFNGSADVTSALTLATVNSNVGTFNNVTVNAKGLVTAASNVSYLTANQTITLSGDISGSGTAAITTTLATISDSGTGTFLKITRNTKGLVTGTVAVAQADITGLLGASSITNTMLSDSGVTAGTYRSVTVNAKGIVTGGTNPAIALGSEVSGILPIANGGSGTSMAFTLGSVIFAGASGVYSQDNANFFWDDTNNRLGIGTATPSAKLHIRSTGALMWLSSTSSTGASYQIIDNPLAGTVYLGIDSSIGDTFNTGLAYTTVLSAASSYALSLQTDGANRITILGNGNVGINTIAPTEKLHISAGNINIDTTTFANQNGIIKKGADRFLHNFNYGNNGTVTTIGQNTFLGVNAGNLTMGSTATETFESSYNTGIGVGSLFSNTKGFYNAAIGFQSLYYNTTGYHNTGSGVESLYLNTTGNYNTASGFQALYANTTGSSNTAFGQEALVTITTGDANTAIGFGTGEGITIGSRNTIIGANVTGLSATLSNNIIIADGDGNRRINVDSSGNTGIDTATPTEKLHVNGNIRYTTLLKPNNIAGTSGQFLGTSGTQDIWTTLTTSHISDIATNYQAKLNGTGFVKATGTTITYDNSTYLTSVGLTTNVTGVLPIANGGTGSATQNFVDLTTTQTVGGTKTFTNTITIGTSGSTMTTGALGFFAGIANVGGSGAIVRGTSYTKLQVGTSDRLVVYDAGVRISAFGTSYLTAPTERLQVEGNIRYNTLLKPNNVSGTNGQFLGTSGTQDIWVTLNLNYNSDVSITTPTGGNVLIYDNTISKWTNQSSAFLTLSNSQIISGLGYTPQVQDADLTAIAALSGTSGILTKTAANTWSLDTSTYLTTSSASSTYQPLLPSGTAGQFLIRNGSNALEFSTLELEPTRLTSNKIAVGDSANYLSSYDNFEFLDSRFISILKTTDSTRSLTMGMYGLSNNSFVTASGGSLTVRGDNGLIFSNFTGGGTQLLTIDNFGKVGVTPLGSSGGGSTSLTSTYIGYGSGGNVVTGTSTFTFLDGRYIHFSSSVSDFNVGTLGTVGFVESVNGNLNLQARGAYGVVVDDGFFKVTELAGTGTRMVVVDTNGKFETQAIPSVTTPTLTATHIGFGNGSNLLSGSANFVYDSAKTAMYFNDGANYLYVGKSVSLSDMYEITAVGARGIQLNTDADIVIKNSGHLYLGAGADNDRVHIGRGASHSSTTHYLVINGEEFSFSMDNVPGWGDTNIATTPQVGDKILFNVVDVGGNKRFVPQKINKKLFSSLSSGDNVLIL